MPATRKRKATSAKTGPEPSKKAKTAAKTKTTPAKKAKTKTTSKKKTKAAVKGKTKGKTTQNTKASKAAAPAASTAAATPAPAAPTTAATAPAAATPIKRSKGKEMSDDIKNLFRTLAAQAAAGGKVTVYDLDVCTAIDLKTVLRLNDRSSTGNRADLMKAVAECLRNGCPPRCPKCGGGRLRYANKKYWCPGYMEDDEFINCSFTAKDGEIVNNPWKSP